MAQWVGAAISAAGSMAGGLFRPSVKKQKNAQKEINSAAAAEAFNYNKQAAEIENQYAKEAAAQENQWSIEAAVRENEYAKEAAAQEYEYGESAADNALNRSKAMFDYQNAYNTPAEQMKRLQEAGLSPGMMYGSGGGTTGTGQMTAGPSGGGASVDSASVGHGRRGSARVGSPNVEAANLAAINQAHTNKKMFDLQLASLFSDIKVKNAQAANLEADAGLKGAETTYTETIKTEEGKEKIANLSALTKATTAETITKELTNSILEVEKEIRSSTQEVTIRSATYNLKKLEQEVDKYDEELYAMKRQNKIGDELYTNTIEQAYTAVRLAQAQILESYARTELNKAGAKLSEEQKNKIMQEVQEFIPRELGIKEGQLGLESEKWKDAGPSGNTIQQLNYILNKTWDKYHWKR